MGFTDFIDFTDLMNLMDYIHPITEKILYI